MEIGLSLSLTSNKGVGVFNPQSLFASGAMGAFVDPSDLTTLFQNTAGSTPVTAAPDPTRRMNDKSGNNLQFLAPSDAARPILGKSGANYYLDTDGVNDYLRATFSLTQPWTRVTAIRQDAWTANSRIYSSAGANVGEFSQYTPSPGVAISNSAAVQGGGGALVGVNAVITEQFNGVSSRISINGGPYTTGDVGAGSPDGWTIGAASTALGSGFAANIRFYGGVMIAGLLSDANILNLQNYFAGKANPTPSGVFAAPTDYVTVSGVRRYSYQSTCVDQAADAVFARGLDVLLPDTYDAGNAYPLIVVLGVETTPSAYAEELQVIKAADLHNTYNAIFCRVYTKTMPWWAVKNDGTVDYERLIRDGLVPWMRTNFSIIPGRQGVSLLGYSKGGFGAFSLILRNPTHFGYAASWDAPLNSSYATMAGSGAVEAFGSAAQYNAFQPATILPANVAAVNDKTRLVLAGYNLYQADQTAFASILSANSVPVSFDSTSRASHNSNSGWMAGVVGMLAALW